VQRTPGDGGFGFQGHLQKVGPPAFYNWASDGRSIHRARKKTPAAVIVAHFMTHAKKVATQRMSIN